MGIHPLEKTSTGRCRRQGGEPALHRLAGKAGSLPFCPTHRHSGVNEYLRFVPLLANETGRSAFSGFILCEKRLF